MEKWNRNSLARFEGETLCVSNADAENEVIGISDCAPLSQEPPITVAPASSDKSGYTVIASAARDFSGWITVTAKWFRRAIVTAFRRIVCEVIAVFNRRIFILEGGLRL